MSHYCCKRCGQRYERCSCHFDAKPTEAPSFATGKSTSKLKKERQERMKEFLKGYPKIRIEVFPQSLTGGARFEKASDALHYYRVVAQNGQTLLTSEAYIGGSRKALRAVRNFVIASGIPRIEVRVLGAGSLACVRIIRMTATSEEELKL